MNWLTIVKGSIPEHSSNIADCLEYAMNTYEHGLSDLELHGCALAAAIASGNGSLADEIAMNSPLFGKPEREAAKRAAATAAVDDVIRTIHSARDHTDFILTLYGTNPVNPVNSMYYLAALLVYKNEAHINGLIHNMQARDGVTDRQLVGIMQIAASVAAINRIIL